MTESLARVLVAAGIVAMVAVAVAVIAQQLLGIRRAGSMAAALVGGRHVATLGAVDAHCTGMSSAVFRVHAFAGAGHSRSVGIELRTHNRASYSSMVAGLSREEARELASLLRRGAGEEEAPPAAPRRAVRDGPV